MKKLISTAIALSCLAAHNLAFANNGAAHYSTIVARWLIPCAGEYVDFAFIRRAIYEDVIYADGTIGSNHLNSRIGGEGIGEQSDSIYYIVKNGDHKILFDEDTDFDETTGLVIAGDHVVWRVEYELQNIEKYEASLVMGKTVDCQVLH